MPIDFSQYSVEPSDFGNLTLSTVPHYQLNPHATIYASTKIILLDLYISNDIFFFFFFHPVLAKKKKG